MLGPPFHGVVGHAPVRALDPAEALRAHLAGVPQDLVPAQTMGLGRARHRPRALRRDPLVDDAVAQVGLGVQDGGAGQGLALLRRQPLPAAITNAASASLQAPPSITLLEQL